MGEDKLKNALTGLAVISVFIFVMVGFISLVGNEYGRDLAEIENGTRFDVSSINDSFKVLNQTAEKGKEGMSSWNPVLIVINIYGFGQNIIGWLFLPIQVITNILTNIFKLPAWTSGVIWGMVIITLLFSAFRLIKQGD